MDNHRPGDVLTGRYLLDALLSEVDQARFWFAWDQVLARNVAIHVVAAEDPRAGRLLDAAARAATVSDTRALKILDAETCDDMVFVVNEWGHGTSLDHLVARNGPLSPRHAAWMTAEVAASLEAAHAVSVPHGRLNPENVLVDALGSIRVIGLAVDAVLHSVDPGPDASIDSRIDADVTDVAGILHFALTGRWVGLSATSVPTVPRYHGKVLRPRQVRAGVPRSLDDLVDGVINADSSTDQPWSARAIATVLSHYVGDPAGIGSEIVASTGATVTLPQVELTPFPERYLSEDDLGEPDVPHDGPKQVDPPLESEPEVELPPPTSVDLPTEVGMPIFDDITDDVSWFTPRPTPPPPPPPLEDPPPKPLFAPEPRVRVDPPAAKALVTPPPSDSFTPLPAVGLSDSGFWPWATGTFGITEYVDPEPVAPKRNWFWIMVAVAVVLLLTIGTWGLIHLREDDSATPTSSAPTTPPTDGIDLPEKISGITATDFDPLDTEDGEEFPEMVDFALDGKPDTFWQTSTYRQQLSPSGYKAGVGLGLDLGGTYAISEVRIRFNGKPTAVSLYVTDSAPNSVSELKPVASDSMGSSGKAAFDPVTGSYLTVWLTSLPQVEGGFRGEVVQIDVYGVRSSG